MSLMCSGLPHFHSSPASVCYCQRKPTNRKCGKAGDGPRMPCVRTYISIRHVSNVLPSLRTLHDIVAISVQNLRLHNRYTHTISTSPEEMGSNQFYPAGLLLSRYHDIMKYQHTPVHSQQLQEWRLQWGCTAERRSGGCGERIHSLHTLIGQERSLEFTRVYWRLLEITRDY